MNILIDEDGNIGYIKGHGLDLSEEGSVTTKRASHVVPLSRVKAIAFCALRTVFGETGRISDWTRGWRGAWIVKIVNGPILGPFTYRVLAIKAEVEWLESNRF